ncbi:MAG: hypothetical protein ACD_39C00818G0002, partial [uncultured bacterium]
CEKHLHLPPAEMKTELLRSLQHHPDKELDDDLTLIIIKRNSISEANP